MTAYRQRHTNRWSMMMMMKSPNRKPHHIFPYFMCAFILTIIYLFFFSLYVSFSNQYTSRLLFHLILSNWKAFWGSFNRFDSERKNTDRDWNMRKMNIYVFCLFNAYCRHSAQFIVIKKILLLSMVHFVRPAFLCVFGCSTVFFYFIF